MGLSPVLALLCTTFFSRAEIRAISELRVRLVPLNLLKLSYACISFADSSKAIQILFDHFSKFILHVLCCLHLDIYICN